MVVVSHSVESELNYSRLPLCLVAQSCPTLCDPMDSGLPGSSVHGILQAGILDWVSISNSREDGHVHTAIFKMDNKQGPPV